MTLFRTKTKLSHQSLKLLRVDITFILSLLIVTDDSLVAITLGSQPSNRLGLFPVLRLHLFGCKPFCRSILLLNSPNVDPTKDCETTARINPIGFAIFRLCRASSVFSRTKKAISSAARASSRTRRQLRIN